MPVEFAVPAAMAAKGATTSFLASPAAAAIGGVAGPAMAMSPLGMATGLAGGIGNAVGNAAAAGGGGGMEVIEQSMSLLALLPFDVLNAAKPISATGEPRRAKLSTAVDREARYSRFF